MRHPAWRDFVRAAGWRPWVAPAAIGIAFVTGVLVDEIGSGGRINLLAPPLAGLRLWNVAVYAGLLERWSAGWRRARVRPAGPLRRLVARLAAFQVPRRKGAPAVAAAVRRFVADWSAAAAPLYRARAARILHGAAAAFAIGVIAGFYLRGLAFEYRASWSSTFLDAEQVRALLAFVLAPGTAVTGIAVPDAAHLAAIRSGATPGSENAAPWLHLIAATVAVVVVVPRLVLALAEGLVERRRARRVDVGFATPYVRRLLRGYRAGPARTVVVPYSYGVASSASAALRALLERALGAGTVEVLPSVAYDAEALETVVVPADATLLVALFNAAATPEAGSHAAFAASLAARAPHHAIAVVDESSVRARFGGDEDRLAQRRHAWEAALAPHAMTPVFVDLSAAPTPSDEDAVLRALDVTS